MAPVVLAALLVLVLLGPRPSAEIVLPEVALPDDLDAYLAGAEAKVSELRPGDEKEIVWAGAPGRATDLSVVYVHGFSADRHEVDPLPADVARALGANLFYTRLTGHGRDGPAMAEATVSAWAADMAEAMAIGRRIGSRVVVIATSTGATLATWAAARQEWAGHLEALVLVSPNYRLRDPAARILMWPWGGTLARLVAGGERSFTPANAGQAAHWTTRYPVEALLPMMALVDLVDGLDLSAVRVPVFMAYSPEDRVVDPSRVEEAFTEWGSTRKRLARVTEGTEADHHVIAGSIMSPDATGPLVRDILVFLRSLHDEERP